jgi:hypothetical protein
MAARLDLAIRGLAIAGALFAGGTGCARSIHFDTESTGGSGGSGGAGAEGGTGGTGGAVTTTSVTSSGCTVADDCLDFNGQCVLGACVNGECVAQPANQGGACDDGLFCTLDDKCNGGVCAGGAALQCASGNACFAGVCDELTDTCIEQPGNDGAQCDDGDPCTYFGSCKNGVCAKGAPVNCSFLNTACTVGVCDPEVGCKTAPANDGVACDDGLFCTEADSCQGGVCTGGAPKQCAPPGGCFVGLCDEATNKCTSTPGNDGAACDDGSPCTASTTCFAGVCTGGQPANDGAVCNDGTSCTTGETCAAGLCTGGMGPTIYFADDFKDSSKGWTLGPEWEIGPAKASVGGSGNPDPGMDHTPTNDNGIAGVVIGGNASTELHPYHYIESPAFDTSAAQGQVILGFYRWLNSDYDPFMHNTIEVYNGAAWVPIWTSGPFPGIEDDSWTFQQYDITAHKSATTRIRFGMDVTDDFAFNISSWNIDDVLVASAACP